MHVVRFLMNINVMNHKRVINVALIDHLKRKDLIDIS